MQTIGRGRFWARGAAALWCGAVLVLAARHVMVGTVAKAEGAHATPAMHLPLVYERNEGQAPEDVRYLARSASLNVLITDDGFRARAQGSDGAWHETRMRLLGASTRPVVTAERPLDGKVHYLRGRSEAGWIKDVPLFGGVRLAQVYPGIDLAYHSQKSDLEFDFVVAPGHDPSLVRMEFSGGSVRLESESGDLLVESAAGPLRVHRPVLYQQGVGGRETVDGHFVVDGQVVSVAVGTYDRGRALVIDPVIAYASFIGGGANDVVRSVAVDASGYAYLVGVTASVDFPTGTVPPLQGSAAGGTDAFIARVAPTGDSLLFATYFGGGADDVALGVALDASGHAHVTGYTESDDFPVSPSALQPSFQGGTRDGFVTKVGPLGAPFVYSSYLGGTGDDEGLTIAADASGHAYVGGRTTSGEFPVTSTALQRDAGGGYDGFLAKLPALGDQFAFSTRFGGAGDDEVRSVAVGPTRLVYVTGVTTSATLPGLGTGALQPTLAGGSDAFLARVRPNGASVEYATFLGGSGADAGNAVATDASGYAYVGGVTTAGLAHAAPGAVTTPAGGADGFVLKVNNSGTALIFNTYVGGPGNDAVSGLSIQHFPRQAYHPEFGVFLPVTTGAVYATGTTAGLTAVDPLQPPGGQDAFVGLVRPTGTSYDFLTPIGGSRAENDPVFPTARPEAAIASVRDGTAIVVGNTLSPDFPVTSHRTQPGLAGGADGFVARVVPGLGNTYLSGTPFNLTSLSDPTSGFPYIVMSFESVLAPGHTTFVTTRAGAPVPGQFSLGQPARYWNITTSAQYAGRIRVCLSYAGLTFLDRNQIEILHDPSGTGTWVALPNRTNHVPSSTVCADADSLSPFTVVESSTFARACDATYDGAVDKRDIDVILKSRNQNSSGLRDPRDVNRSGRIDLKDARQCTAQCDRAYCAIS